MIKVIGKNNCSLCTLTKNLLEKAKIDYEYCKLEDFNENDKKKYITEARNKGILQMPLIIYKNEYITFQQLKKMIDTQEV